MKESMDSEDIDLDGIDIDDTESRFDINEYMKGIDLSNSKEELKKKLVEFHRARKLLDRNTIQVLTLLGDSERSKRIKEALTEVHKVILETESSSVDEIATECENIEGMEELMLNKNKRFYGAKEIFDEYEEHPMQKKMKRAKVLSKREMIKTKTPNSYIRTLFDSKGQWYLLQENEKLRMENEELRLKEMLSMMKPDDIGAELREISQDFKKVAAFWLYTNNKGDVSHKTVGALLSVSDRTVRRWFKEIEEALAQP